MKILFYTQGLSIAPEPQDFLRALPEAEVRHWEPGDTGPADFAIVWRPPRELFAGRDDLRAVFNLGAGVDAILGLERAHPGTLPKHALLVRLEDTGMASQMSEYVTYAVLRYLRRFDEYAHLQAQQRWKVLERHPRETFVIGVLGLGVLGTHVAQTLSSFGLPVRGFSRGEKKIKGIDCYAGANEFDAFMDEVKVLVNLLPSTPDTDGILNARTFSRLTRGAYLINVARGAHLVENDLLEALSNGQIAAATLDVFHQEPLPVSHAFWSHPHITMTPHCSAETLRDESMSQIVQKIRELARGESIGGIVDVERGY
ncbi:2-hydroxyacid dehydrogenase [Dyella tabacisoli]|uniref:Glyoxylate/hydroxypyruvate reductase A n=1 Tax=Dyella tabacisoli TaxID=2282381 RepID=A0A369UQG4_9GAMM|nr:glyoxylate/hydroxypyruvate reductase A [Dyella tabacisoli]RDD81978.1 glyoxylate/hydroxypyruvate reductase A [Dyella tabacisoli]